MNTPSVTISLNYTVLPEDAPALLQKLLASLPPGATATAENRTPAARPWPAIPSTAGEAYRKVAEENLQRLHDDDITNDGWGEVDDLSGLIQSLRPEARKVVMRAIENGGHVTREEVYELLGRDRSQSLKGFTKPVQSLTDRLKSIGALPDDAKPLLAPIYKKSKTYQQAQGFAVPIQVVSLMAQRAATTS